MFYSRNLFDTIIIILCVTAGANLHTPSNTSKASFIEFILDTELARPNNLANGNYALNTTDRRSNFCPMLRNILNPNQIKFCLKHHDILEAIVPQISKLAKSECAKITENFRWNCSSIEPFLERSNFLGGYNYLFAIQ